MCFGEGVSEVATRLFDSLWVGWCRNSLVPSIFERTAMMHIVSQMTPPLQVVYAIDTITLSLFYIQISSQSITITLCQCHAMPK